MTTALPTGPSPVPAVGEIPFFSQARTFAEIWATVANHIEDVADRGKYSHGHKVAEFERALAEYTGARHVVAVNSGTDALVLLLRAAGLAPGQPVVVPAFSFVASASSVVLAGGSPVFADIEPDGYGIDPAEVARVAPEGAFVMPVHLFCQLADLDGVLDVARRKSLTVVEDSAEAIGMRWRGVHAGLAGVGGVLSFFPAKTLGALGDAGAVLTDDPDIAETVGALRHHGRFGRTLAHFPGIANPTALSGVNSKMDDIQAAVLLAKLARLEADIARRAELAVAYDERLRDVPGVLRLPVPVPREAPTRPVWYVYLIEVERRDELAAHLAACGVGTEIYYPTPLHLQPCFGYLRGVPGEFPVAEAVCRRTIALPLYPDLSEAEVDLVCDHLRDFYTGSGS
ncbi:DegT/DnrJ/EryC1/StrS family aminotransferase [Actinophytocola sp.]|uniref:DegT/DnrJ/EryC1/StrS family aminotransferase n=1 Tax=Actinophytocola sp. TaxID=1872138 RepID=UPI00389A3FB2